MTDDSNLLEAELARLSLELPKTAGYRFWAPVGTDTPTALAKDSRFNDTWPLAWIPTGDAPGASQLAELLRVTSYQRAEGDTVITVISRAVDGDAWRAIGMPDPSMIACMVGWESMDSRVRIVGQGAVEAAVLDAAISETHRRSPAMANDIGHSVAVFHEKRYSGYWLAICRDCTPSLPLPFPTEAAAEAWAIMHEAPTGLMYERRDRVSTSGYIFSIPTKEPKS